MSNDWAWRLPSLLQALPSVAQLLGLWGVPESPRWLVNKGREAEALETLAYYHADGNKDDPLVRYEFEEIKAAIKFDKEVAAKVGYRTMFATPGNRRRMRIIIAIAFFSQWSANGLASYYLKKILDNIGIVNPTHQLLINGILQIWNLAWALLASSLVNKLSRRLLFLSSCIGMFIFFSCWTIGQAVFTEKGSRAAGNAVIAFIFLYYAAYDLAFTPLIVAYTVEILPYSLRAKGFNVFNFTISLALIFNQYANPIALDKLLWKYQIVYIVWLAFETVFCYFYVVETIGLTLEETSILFDGKEAAQQIIAATAQGQHVHDSASDEKASIEEKDK